MKTKSFRSPAEAMAAFELALANHINEKFEEGLYFGDNDHCLAVFGESIKSVVGMDAPYFVHGIDGTVMSCASFSEAVWGAALLAGIDQRISFSEYKTARGGWFFVEWDIEPVALPVSAVVISESDNKLELLPVIASTVSDMIALAGDMLASHGPCSVSVPYSFYMAYGRGGNRPYFPVPLFLFPVEKRPFARPSALLMRLLDRAASIAATVAPTSPAVVRSDVVARSRYLENGRDGSRFLPCPRQWSDHVKIKGKFGASFLKKWDEAAQYAGSAIDAMMRIQKMGVPFSLHLVSHTSGCDSERWYVGAITKFDRFGYVVKS
jgi:hypothetical protein